MAKKRTLLATLLLCGLSATAQNRPPLMGWNSWNAFRVYINDSIITKQADLFIEKGLKEAGYSYLNIDDGFFGARDENGKMTLNTSRFPNGMKKVVNHIHGLGLKAGIYAEAGHNTCGSYNDFDNDLLGIGAGMYGHEDQDAQLYFGEWGFDFIKVDYCGGNDLRLEEEKRYRTIREAIDRVNPKVDMTVCRWDYPGTWVKDMAWTARISGDIHASWGSIRYIMDKNMYLSAYARDGYYNDMDMLVVGFADGSIVGGSGLSATEEKAHFGLWCIMSSPLLIGCDLNTLSERSLALLKNKELIAINQDPLGIQPHVAHRCGEGYVFVKDLEKRRGNKRAVALYNPSDEPCEFIVPLTAIGFERKVTVRDLLYAQDIGECVENMRVTLPPRSAHILKVEGKKRIEPTRYEAEWAYLPRYNEMGWNHKNIRYTRNKEASGGAMVSYLGGSPENYAEWDRIYSEKGGTHQMTIHYTYGKGRKIELTVNGVAQEIKQLADNNDPNQISLMVELKKGENVIRMGNSYGWAPDVDCFDLVAEKGK